MDGAKKGSVASIVVFMNTLKGLVMMKRMLFSPRDALHELLCPDEIVSSPTTVDVEVAAENDGVVRVHQVTWAVILKSGMYVRICPIY